MNSWQTRATILRLVVLIFTTSGLSTGLLAQDVGIPRIEDIVVGCRDNPSGREAISLTVESAWVQDNALFADLLVTNRSHSAVRFPGRNVGGHYWDAVLYNSKREPIMYCGGVSDINLDPQIEVISDNDVLSVEPGATVTLRALYLAPFWPYLREPKYGVRSFKVTYTGWSSVVVHADAAELNKLRGFIKQASERQCSLYDGELTSRAHPFKP